MSSLDAFQFQDAPLIQGRDYDYDELMSKAKYHGCVSVKATDPLYILYTSGTTGTPKVSHTADQINFSACLVFIINSCTSLLPINSKKNSEILVGSAKLEHIDLIVNF